MTTRPVLTKPTPLDDAKRAVDHLVAELQSGLDEHNADQFNRSFADDLLWGGPFGATVTGYDDLHSIHLRLMAEAAAGRSRYDVVTVSAPAPNVALAQVRRTPLDPGDEFAEMALYVLVERDGRWWLAAGQNTQIQPGRSATDRDPTD